MYIERLMYNEEALRKLSIEGLNEERFARPRMSWPVLRIQKGKLSKGALEDLQGVQ